MKSHRIKSNRTQSSPRRNLTKWSPGKPGGNFPLHNPKEGIERLWMSLKYGYLGIGSKSKQGLDFLRALLFSCCWSEDCFRREFNWRAGKGTKLSGSLSRHNDGCLDRNSDIRCLEGLGFFHGPCDSNPPHLVGFEIKEFPGVNCKWLEKNIIMKFSPTKIHELFPPPHATLAPTVQVDPCRWLAPGPNQPTNQLLRFVVLLHRRFLEIPSAGSSIVGLVLSIGAAPFLHRIILFNTKCHRDGLRSWWELELSKEDLAVCWGNEGNRKGR